MTRRLFKTRVALSLGVLSLGAWTGAAALFTDTASSEGTFTAGEVQIDASPATALFAVTGMAPGDVAYAALTVSNGGSLELRYDLDATATDSDATNPLSGQIAAEVRRVAADCDATTFDASTDVVSAASALDDVTATAQVMAPGASEVHCVRVELPSATGNAYQGGSTTVTFTFTAVQTANNPG